ncbi:hypothetical protein V5O48_000763 [Marasmius crinis-equi]|uniref:Uncharacterized protein n=1 Tax=Marasmius crinis-equi TaxID=585013 RepID=A0ABR3G0F5_9AGAR
MKLKSRRQKIRTSSAADQDEYQPFLSQPTLYIPNPPPTVKLQNIAAALVGYGTSIHSIYFISVRQRPRLGKFSGRSTRRRWVRVEFCSIEMAEQAYVTLHRRPVPGVSPQVLLNFRFTPYFSSVPSGIIATPTTATVAISNKRPVSQTRAVVEPSSVKRHDVGKRKVEQFVTSKKPAPTLATTGCSPSRPVEVKRREFTKGPLEYSGLLEALELDGGSDDSASDHSQVGDETEDYLNTSERVLYPIDEEAEENDENEEDADVDSDIYSDAESLIEMLHKFDSLDTTQHELDTANTTVEPDLPHPLATSPKSDPGSSTKSLRRSISTISSVPVPVPKVIPAVPAPNEVHKPCQRPHTTPESQELINSQTSTIISLRKDLYDLLKAADSQTLIIEGLRNLIRQLEWDKADLLGMVDSARENSTRQVKLMQVQVEEMETRMGFMEARLNLAEAKCRVFEKNGNRSGTSGLSEEEMERRKLSELEDSCRHLADMIAHDTHQKNLAARRERIRLREKVITEQARRLREQEERRQVLMEEEAARKIHGAEDRQRREKDRRRKLRREQAEAKERKRCCERDMQKWGTGEWTSPRALERFKIVLAEFESITYTEDQPLTMGSVPWPILTDPFDVDTEDPGKALEELEWGMVEVFFRDIAKYVDLTEYKTLLERTNLAFHPDRWKARRLLDTVVEEDVRGWLEAKGNMVAQAVTPLWKESKQYRN